MAARQSISRFLDRDLPAADFPAREGVREPLQWGFWNAIWSVPTTRPAPAGRSVDLALLGGDPENFASFCSAPIPSTSSGGSPSRP